MIHETKQCVVNSKSQCEVKRFASLEEFIAWSPDDYLDDKNTSDYAKWIGRKLGDAQNARRLANEVWDEGLQLFDDAKSKVSSHSLPAPKTRRRRARFDEFGGDEVCIDRLRAGAPFWRTTSREFSSGPTTLTLAVHTTAAAVRSAESLNWRGVAAVVLCELLESAGYRVRIISYDYGCESYDDGSSAMNMLTLKEFNEPLDTAGLVAALSGWFFRSFGIGAIHRSARGVNHASGYGYANELTPAQFETITGDKPSAMVQNVWDESSAIDLIEQTMAQLESGALVA
jgi:hypothetical protein